MAAIILPRKWQTQPQGPVEIDLSNNISNAIAHSVTPVTNINGFRSIFGDPITTVGSLTKEASNLGLGSRVSSGNYVYGKSVINVSAPFSVALSYIFKAIPYERSLFSLGNNATDASAALIIQGIDSNAVRVLFNGGWKFTVSGAGVVNRPTHLVLTYGGGVLNAYLDGKLTNSSTTASSGNNTNFYYGSGYASQPDALLYEMHQWRRELLAAEAWSLYSKRYEIFKPRKQVLYFTTAGGPTNQDLTVVDSTHAHSPANVALTSASLLTVTIATHEHVAANVALSASGAATLTLTEATHAHAVDNIALSSAYYLGVVDSTHAHVVDPVSLDNTGSAILSLVDSTHTHSVANIVLSSASALAIVDTIHANIADSVALSTVTQSSLAVVDALHAHVVDSVALSIPGVMTLTAEDIAAIANAVWAHPNALTLQKFMGLK